MPTLTAPPTQIRGSIGDPVAAKNDSLDVRLIQTLLNSAIANGDLNGPALQVTGQMNTETLRALDAYQRRNGVSGRNPHAAPRDPKPPSAPNTILIEPGSPAIAALIKNPLVDPRWSEYDDTIKSEVSSYNARLRSVVPGYTDLDWRYVKAMVWTEVMAGPDHPAWRTRPMQIGNPGDPGLKVITEGLDHSDLVTPQDLRSSLRLGVPATGQQNVRAGIAYLFHRAAAPYYQQKQVIDDPAIQSHTLSKGETLSTLAPKLHTTVQEIVDQSAIDPEQISKLMPGVELKYRKLHMEWTVSGWSDWQQAIKMYNYPGDPHYLDKVNRNYSKIAANFAR